MAYIHLIGFPSPYPIFKQISLKWDSRALCGQIEGERQDVELPFPLKLKIVKNIFVDDYYFGWLFL